MPSDAKLEAGLRNAAQSILAELGTVTVNAARARAEEQLQLGKDFFKTDEAWKRRSKDIVERVVQDEPSEDDSGREQPASSTIKHSTHSKQQPAKRQKIDHQSKQRRSGSSLSRSQQPTLPESSSQSSDVQEGLDETASTAQSAQSKVSKKDLAEQDDDSDMSSLLDEPPARAKKKGKPDRAPKKSTTANSKALTPDQEMIKTLQSQLMKCGIRKLWHRELAPYNTEKEKIRHLRKMLENAGMTGRFSAAKAEQIREARELAADLESAKEYERSWGTEHTTKRAARSRALRTESKDVSGLDSDESSQADKPPVEAGAATGLVDFGDSGDDYSD